MTSFNSKRAGNRDKYLTDGSHISPSERLLIKLKITSMYITNVQPSNTPQIVPIIPTKAPHRKKTFIMEDWVNPMVLKIAISRPLFFTNIIRPDTIFIDAINTKMDKIKNITLSSISSACKNAPELSFQVQYERLEEVLRTLFKRFSLIISGSSKIISISSAKPSTPKKV